MRDESVTDVAHAAGAHTGPGQSGTGGEHWELAAVPVKSVLETQVLARS